MSTTREHSLYRVWIADVGSWRATHWSDVPPAATAIEPAKESFAGESEVQPFLEGFNSVMIRSGARLWAVVVQVTLRFEGDLVPGGPFAAPHA